MTVNNTFEPGPRLLDGSKVNDAIGNPAFSHENTITATAAGTVTTSREMTETVSRLSTVASGAGVALPYPSGGEMKFIVNNGANAVTVFAKGGATIDGTAGATGVAQAAAAHALYFAVAAGVWIKMTGA